MIECTAAVGAFGPRFGSDAGGDADQGRREKSGQFVEVIVLANLSGPLGVLEGACERAGDSFEVGDHK